MWVQLWKVNNVSATKTLQDSYANIIWDPIYENYSLVVMKAAQKVGSSLIKFNHTIAYLSNWQSSH